MAQTVVGANEFTEQPVAESYSPSKGLTTTRTWLGPRDLYDAKRDQIIEELEPSSLTGSKGTASQIVATFLNPEYNAISPEDNAVWELIPTPVDRPLGTHPSFNTSQSTQALLERIDKAIAEGRGQDTDWNLDFGLTGLNEYRDLKAKGTDSYRTWSYIVRRTYTSTLFGIDKFEDTDAGSVVSWSGIGLPGNVKFGQPVFNKWDGSNVETIPIDQWLVNPATVRFESKQYTISKEWWGALGWYATLYSGGNADSDSDGSSIG